MTTDNTQETIYDMTLEDLKKQVIGRVVRKVDQQNGTISLDDGTELEFQDTSGCCAWFNAQLEAGNLVDNAVTDVSLTDTPGDAYDVEDYTLHILAADTRICDVHITGNPTSGYYCLSIDLVVRGVKR